MDQGLEVNLKTIKPVQIIISKPSLSILGQATFFFRIGTINILFKKFLFILLTISNEYKFVSYLCPIIISFILGAWSLICLKQGAT